MSIDELFARFPEIPVDLRDEPVLAKLAAACGELLAVAERPSNCSTGHDAGNHFYLKLIGPMAFYGYGLASRERVVEDLRELLAERDVDPEGFAASLLPADTVASQVKGPDCA